MLMKKSFWPPLVLALLATLLSGCAVTEKKQTTPPDGYGPSVTTPISTDPDLPGLRPSLPSWPADCLLAGIEGLLGRVTASRATFPADVDAFRAA